MSFVVCEECGFLYECDNFQLCPTCKLIAEADETDFFYDGEETFELKKVS